jgi:UDP-glucose 4,6-dehydratase
MHKIVVTGGAGFIGSHVVERLIREYPEARIDIIDRMTYAADIENLDGKLERGHRHLHVGDLCDFDLCVRVTRGADCVVHLAAESHVDNSFGNSLNFTRSNTLGTHALLEACRLNKVQRIIHVSTDEVYGETHESEHKETDSLNPTNPYSASKAGADMIVNSYIYSFKLPVMLVRANNIFGIRQYPEKIIPRFCVQGLLHQKFTVHGNGMNRRRYLAVQDFADAIVLLLQRGELGEIYNVGSDCEYTNLEIVDIIAEELGISAEQNTIFIADRPFNDFRYAVNCDKLRALGWKRRYQLEDKLPEVVDWYRENLGRYTTLFDKVELPTEVVLSI